MTELVENPGLAWTFLTAAVVLEVCATLSLRNAALGKRRWYIAVVLGYVLAFTCLGASLNLGMPLGVAYGIWAAAGVALTALGSRILFKEPLTPTMIVGIVMIATGVLLVELGAQGAGSAG